jgi:beta-galactosidase GanA
VENEPGTWGAVRDYSPEAQKLFEAAVPAELLAALKKTAPHAGATWKEVFGAAADESFHAWSVARFVGQVAAAGKAEYALPLYANAALRDPFNAPVGSYESGAPTDNNLDIWKAAAPALDLLAPDIYMNERPKILKVIELYARPDNALLVPETAGYPGFARYFFAALDAGAIGYAPFGMDNTGYSGSPAGEAKSHEEQYAQFALNYQLVAPMMREVARLNFEGKLRAVIEPDDTHVQTVDFGAWKVTVTYGVNPFGYGQTPKGNPDHNGRAIIGQLGPDEFLVAGLYCRVDFAPADSAKQREYLRVEEGGYAKGAFQPIRIWNGDQTDYGMNFSGAPQVLRVRLGTY